MNFTDKGIELHVSKSSDSQSVYVTKGDGDYAPAVCAVLANRFADISIPDMRINAAIVSGIPEMLEVLKLVMEMTLVQPGAASKIDREPDINKLRDLCEKAMVKMSSGGHFDLK